MLERPPKVPADVSAPAATETAETRLEALSREVERLRVLASRERGLVEAILMHSPHGIIVSDPNGKLTLQNKAAEKIWAGSATADTIASWGQYRAFHPDGRPFEGGDWSMARALMKREVTEAEEIHFQRFDDTLGIMIGSSAPLLGENGELEGALSIFTDISRLKQQENELVREEAQRRFINSASALLASTLDYAPTLTSVAKLSVPTIADWCAVDILEPGGKLERLAVAHADPEKIHWAEDITRRYPPDPRSPYGADEVARSGVSQLMSEIPEALLVQAAVDEEHLRLIRELGLRSSMLVPLRCRGKTLGVITFVSTDSGRKFDAKDLAMAEELASIAGLAVENARLYREARDANRTKDEFLATVSHELRTPLNAILGWASLLRMGKLSQEKQDSAFETIERNARAQSQLIEDLLDVSRIISGNLRLEFRSLDLTVLIEAAVDALRLAAESKGVLLRLLLDEDARHATGDAVRLQQVVWNLVSNAVKFTDRGGEVTVRLQREESQAVIRVTDSGRGIDPDFLPHIFERFKQARGSTTRAHGGLGLGLAIVKHLVELHGGTVTAASAGAKQGAAFQVKLPVAAVPLRASGPNAAASTPAGAPILDGLRILVVDDEPDARTLLVAVLEGRGARVIPVGSAAAALREIERHAPDVLVSDIGMPDQDGYDLIRAVRTVLKQSPKTLPAAALTAFARTEDRTRAMLAGFQSHVAKPVEPEELVIVVATLAGRTGGWTDPDSSAR